VHDSDDASRIARLEEDMAKTREDLAGLKGYIRGAVFAATGACTLIGFIVGVLMHYGH
jgi:hypothetical protein